MRLVPRAYKKWASGLMVYAGSERKPESFLKQALILSFAVGALLGILTGQLLVVGIPVFLGFFVLFHGLLLLAVERRTGFVENILPDALQLIAANIRSGFIPSRALLLSARKEFGPLSEGIKMAGKEMVSGKSLNESLVYVNKSIKSDILDSTLKLIARGFTSGGQLTSLFEETAADIRRKAAINKEVKANIVIYGMFITFAAAIGAPALYALSGFLVGTISSLSGAAEIPEDFASQVPLLQFGIDISQEFLFVFSIVAIIITTFFAGLIIGIINTGKERGGVKFIPMFMVLALAVFFIARAVINTMFAGIVPV